MTTTAELIERARAASPIFDDATDTANLINDLADALERLQAEREDNKRLAAELVLAAKDRDSAEAHLAELFAQEPVAYLKFWAAQMYAGHGNIETDEGFEVCKQGEVGMDGHPAFPVFARPVSAAQPECTHDCNQGRDCRCGKGPA